MISLIAGVDKNFLIGNNNQLPWERIPADMKHLREKTIGKTIVMGRKTFDSIGKPLPNRTNIILTGDKNYKAEGCTIVHSIEEIKALSNSTNEIIIFGGSTLYKEFIPLVQKMYITFIDGSFKGDVHFPLKDFSNWQIEEDEILQPSEKNKWKLRFTTFTKSV